MASALLISDRKVVKYLSASALRIGFCSATQRHHGRVRVMNRMKWSEGHRVDIQPRSVPALYMRHNRTAHSQLSA
jgi:hypothetical protein